VRDPFGMPAAGIVVRAGNGGETVTNRRSGAYALRVPPGWSGTVRPDKWGRYEFRPSRRSYRNLRSNPRGQNFAMAPYDRYVRAVGFKPSRGGARTLTLGLGRSYNVTGLYGWKNFTGNADWQLVWAIDGREFQRINDNNQVNFSFVPTLEREISILTPKYVPNQLGTHTIRFYFAGNLGDDNQANDSVTATFTVVQTPPPNLLVKPAERALMHNAGRTSFVITNTEPGTRMRYTVSESVSWLRITSGASGVNGGRVYLACDANNSSRDRTAIIKIAAPGASGSPAYVKLFQHRNFLLRSGRLSKSGLRPAPARPTAWTRSATSPWVESPELVDGDLQSVWTGRPGEAPWTVALDFGTILPLSPPTILYAGKSWETGNLLGTRDLHEWFDLGPAARGPVPCRALYFNLSAGEEAAPAIREIQWNHAGPEAAR
jgi:hypothetical protein